MVRYAAGTALVALLIVAGTAVRAWQIAGADQRGPADAIVVLGAAQYDGEPSPVFQARLDHAADLFAEGVAPAVLVLGGGQDGDRTTEGAAGREYLIAAGLDPAAVVAVGDGDDTLGSLRAARHVLAERDWTSVVLVTDPWHSARAALIARDLGLEVQVSPVRQGPALRDGVAVPYLLRETVAILFYRLTGAPSGAGSPVL